ncbi:sugar O-acetyltransferase [Salinicoccus sp. ID82-1]|uniref:sugar O-acetyltransferase n=1 Tax=Salinicoccus sp. ID82-1 TaxID=2820269 RepID=UPI001F189E67|nr:sugar O-acetyltransferase [Salinicoccus sp. ID82-1]MCG1009614.1 sugar O-acetyltransferase [Salinicoccus sp. ID82-1]
MTEKEKMLKGEYYDPQDPTLVHLRDNADNLMNQYNHPGGGDKGQLLDMLFGYHVEGLSIRAPFFCDYGINIRVGRNFYANHNCVFLDVAKITIGDDVLLGPNVSLITVNHPIDPEKRRQKLEYGKPITIGDNVWIGADVTVNPGVTIGENAVIGSGSVVVKDVPANTVAAGNPCRVIRAIEE